METDLDGKQAEAEVALAKAAEAKYLAAEKKLTALLATVGSTDSERALLAEVTAAAAIALPAIRMSVQQGSNRETEAAVLTLVNDVRPEETKMREKVEALVAVQRQLTEEASAAMSSLERRAQMIAGALVVVALVLGGTIAWSITNSVTQPIGRAVVVAERIAQGDLSSQIEVRIHDETGRLLDANRAMQEKLRSLVGGIRQAADS
ncbi:MAG: HAMP domain-containing protein, partial [Rhodoferax sp.]